MDRDGQYYSKFVHTVVEMPGKKIHNKFIEDPVDIQSHSFSNARIYTTGRR